MYLGQRSAAPKHIGSRHALAFTRGATRPLGGRGRFRYDPQSSGSPRRQFRANYRVDGAPERVFEVMSQSMLPLVPPVCSSSLQSSAAAPESRPYLTLLHCLQALPLDLPSADVQLFQRASTAWQHLCTKGTPQPPSVASQHSGPAPAVSAAPQLTRQVTDVPAKYMRQNVARIFSC